MKYRLKPRFYVITITTGLIVSGLAVQHIDATCSEKIETGQVIKPAVVYAEEIAEPEVPEEPEPVNLGEFTITHYCSCPICCGEYAIGRPVDENGNEIVYTAIMEVAEHDKTIAVDPDVIPLGSTVIINGKEYVANDTGRLIKGNRIDIYINDHQEAWDRGKFTAEVYMEG